ncbi:MAG: hypothetical protein ACLUPV_04525 [Bilophila wadsworthia]
MRIRFTYHPMPSRKHAHHERNQAVLEDGITIGGKSLKEHRRR